MAIDLKTEDLITFADLASGLPRRRGNRPVHPSTIHRWRHPGLKGVKLDALRVGGCWVTSWQAFRRFCEQLTEVEATSSPKPSSKNQADESHKKADADLEDAGW